MKQKISSKIGMIIVISIVLIVGVGMLTNLINERSSLRNKAVRGMAESSINAQTVVGPILVVPYKKYGESKTIYIVPSELSITSNVNVTRRYRNIYDLKMYDAATTFEGNFDLSKYINPEDLDYIGKPYLVMSVSDMRGVKNNLSFSLNGAPLSVEPVSGLPKFSSALVGEIKNISLFNSSKIGFNIQLDIQGSQSFYFVPIGTMTNVNITSNWPDPSFDGLHLPQSRKVSNKGFTAEWSLNQFSNEAPMKTLSCLATKGCSNLMQGSSGFKIIDSVDQYTQSDRSVKYAILFIGLTFAGFFLFEVLRGINIHPVQYSFVGIALTLFFLLLFSLSEHIGFLWAYIISSIATITLISFYIRSILENLKQVVGFSILLIILYAVLYLLISGEEYNLLLGSILLFVSLGASMVLTRNIDWYAISQSKAEKKIKLKTPIAEDNNVES